MVVTSGYLMATTGYFWLLLVTSRYFLLLLVSRFSNNELAALYIPGSSKVHAAYSYRKLENYLYLLVLSLASEILAPLLPLIPCLLGVELM